MRTTNTIMNEAMDCLISKLGVVETEIFISNLMREPFDYTEWQRKKFDNVSLDEFCDNAVNYCKNQGN
ncbi:MAG: hypothetical protein K6C13_13055 [Oscillospiraceae bacterium]|nr:hypothetical protein [Oscillospiraceae bacterium]